MTRIRAAVIGGGGNGEHDVSLASAAAVADALDPSRYDVVRLTVGRDGAWPGGLPAAVGILQGCDVALPIVHGPRGEDRAPAPHRHPGRHAGAPPRLERHVPQVVAGPEHHQR
ncbi:hypothetical protein ABZU58_37830, partial [Actinoplanes sp. NPDC005259]